jgi:hypothetical protein
MRLRWMLAASLMFCGLGAVAAGAQSHGAPGTELQYAADGRLLFPEDYREWTYVTSGMDMSYTATGAADHHMFDNVFVTPASCRSFLATGHWPDRTMFVLEAC